VVVDDFYIVGTVVGHALTMVERLSDAAPIHGDG
jgi:hypothetical protein